MKQLIRYFSIAIIFLSFSAYAVSQDGKNVFKYAVRGMAEVSYEVACRNNLNGEKIFSGKIRSSEERINISILSSGYYLISIKDNNSNYVNKKFIKFD